MSVLKISNLVKRFEGVVAVDDLSFSVSPGEIFGFLGGNGAGKTTTLRMVLDIIRPTSGTISVLGSPPDRRNAQAIGFLPEERGLYAGMSAIDTIVYFGRLKGMKPSDARSRGMELLSRFDLADRAYAQLLKLEGAKASILNNQGYSYILRGDMKQARKGLSNAHALAPDNIVIEGNLKLANKA